MASYKALEIVQDGLDHHAGATMSGDIDTMMAYSDIPCAIETLSGRVIAANTSEMRAICEALVCSINAKKLSHMVRRCFEAEFKDDDTIWATYETRFLRNGVELAEDTYTSFIILKKRIDGWRFSGIQLLVSEGDPVSATLKSRFG
ncbi:hypothetical protein J4E08_23055 [Sagittula sp. NFXS13]|uniref:SnoaL-like domain-containing protein n=1 Tax=Sagittula marina TaxID=943940 RepID=A0A7W6DS28_9RHOB|nr:hypothetical protein [Sagittula marina]MBB3988161.1 hypothetical protein [Sagittula marina]